MEYISANTKCLRVLLNNGRVKSNVPLGSSFSFYPLFLFFFLLFLELKDWFLRARANVQKFGKLFFFCLLLPLPASVCLGL